MGNCATCCGKADTNEIVTEKQNHKLKGVSNDNTYGGYEAGCVNGQKRS